MSAGGGGADGHQPQHAGAVRGAHGPHRRDRARRGGLVYTDGANLNALLGITRPGDLGTTSCTSTCTRPSRLPTAAAARARARWASRTSWPPTCPVPVVSTSSWARRPRASTPGSTSPTPSGACTPTSATWACMVRAYAYLRSLGPEGLRRCAEMAVLNANYLLARLRGAYHVPYDRPVMHECVLSDRAASRRPASPPWTWPSD